MDILCAHCGAPEPIAAGQGDRRRPAGDFYLCEACGKMSVVTDTGMRRATKSELTEAATDWHSKKIRLTAMIGFDARG